MSIPVLIFTPTPGFGELIKQTLEESGRYQVFLAANSSEALVLANILSINTLALAILDISISEVGAEDAALELGRRLRERFPDMRLVVIPPDNDPRDPLVRELKANGYLTKPFYLPDLLDTLEESLKSESAGQMVGLSGDTDEARVKGITSGARSASPASSLLEDPAFIRQRLTELFPRASSKSVMILRQGELWASAGDLPDPAIHELAGIAAQNWEAGGNSDLTRFIHLDSTGTEVMLYATKAGKGLVLVLVYDVDTPYSKMRSQASILARELSSPTFSPASEPSRNPVGTKTIPGETLPTRTELPTPSNLPALFDDVPPPSPDNRKSTPPVPGELQKADIPMETVEIKEEEPEELADTRPMPVPVTVAVQSEPPGQPNPTDQLAETLVGAEPEGNTVPTTVPELQPVTAAVADIHYACMLVPRLPGHHLTGELATHLPDWVRQLCLAFGWRLEFLSVRPDYLLWIVCATPAISPSFIVRMIRLHTSQRIFAGFPDLEEDNPSGNFWAPGYLVMSGSQPPPAEVMHEYIQRTRRRQGAPVPGTN